MWSTKSIEFKLCNLKCGPPWASKRPRWKNSPSQVSQFFPGEWGMGQPHLSSLRFFFLICFKNLLQILFKRDNWGEIKGKLEWTYTRLNFSSLQTQFLCRELQSKMKFKTNTYIAFSPALLQLHISIGDINSILSRRWDMPPSPVFPTTEIQLLT